MTGKVAPVSELASQNILIRENHLVARLFSKRITGAPLPHEMGHRRRGRYLGGPYQRERRHRIVTTAQLEVTRNFI